MDGLESNATSARPVSLGQCASLARVTDLGQVVTKALAVVEIARVTPASRASYAIAALSAIMAPPASRVSASLVECAPRASTELERANVLPTDTGDTARGARWDTSVSTARRAAAGHTVDAATE